MDVSYSIKDLATPHATNVAEAGRVDCQHPWAVSIRLCSKVAREAPGVGKWEASELMTKAG